MYDATNMALHKSRIRTRLVCSSLGAQRQEVPKFRDMEGAPHPTLLPLELLEVLEAGVPPAAGDTRYHYREGGVLRWGCAAHVLRGRQRPEGSPERVLIV